MPAVLLQETVIILLGVYGFGDDFEETNIYIVPLLDLSYKPKKANITPFLRISGALNQNSFRTFTNLAHFLVNH